MTRTIDYGAMMHRAMRSLIQEVLQDVATHGLPGEHHFLITFDTRHEGVSMADWLRERYPDRVDDVELFSDFGLLTPRTLLGHGVFLDHAERHAVAEARTVLVHCPTANLFLQAGAMPRQGHQAASVRTSLGTDVAGGPDRAMPRVARAMIETAKIRSDRFPSAAEAWWEITAGNAASLGWAKTGRIEAGCEADLLVLRPTIRAAGHPDPLGQLLYAWDERWIERVVIGGDRGRRDFVP